MQVTKQQVYDKPQSKALSCMRGVCRPFLLGDVNVPSTCWRVHAGLLVIHSVSTTSPCIASCMPLIPWYVNGMPDCSAPDAGRMQHDDTVLATCRHSQPVSQPVLTSKPPTFWLRLPPRCVDLPADQVTQEVLKALVKPVVALRRGGAGRAWCSVGCAKMGAQATCRACNAC